MLIQIQTPGGPRVISAEGVGGGRYFSEPKRHEILLAKLFIEEGCLCSKTPTVSSYWLKHRCEEWVGDCYISNGAMIVAAIELNVPFQYRPEYGLNLKLGIKKRHLQKWQVSTR